MPSLTGLVYKAGDTSRTNNTVADDPDLQFTMTATKSYLVTAQVELYCAATPDFQFRFYAQGSPTFAAGIQEGTSTLFTTPTLGSAGVVVIYWGSIHAAGTSTLFAINGTATGSQRGFIRLRGLVTCGASNALFSFQWAQLVTNATAATVYAGSWMNWEDVTAEM